MTEEIKQKIEIGCRDICENSNGSWIDISIESAEFGYSLSEARIKELESQMADSLKLYECQNNAVIKRDERIKELEAGLVNLRHGLFKDEQAVNNYIDQLLTK